MPKATEQELMQVRELYLGKRVRIYNSKEIRVTRIEAVNTEFPCFHFFETDHPQDVGYVATLANVSRIADRPTRAKGASR